MENTEAIHHETTPTSRHAELKQVEKYGAFPLTFRFFPYQKGV